MTMSTRFRWITTAVLALLFSVSASAFAQNVTITGKVLSDAGQPLYGANVVIEALQISVGTTAQGVYTITVPGARAGTDRQHARSCDRVSAAGDECAAFTGHPDAQLRDED